MTLPYRQHHKYTKPPPEPKPCFGSFFIDFPSILR